MPCSPSMFFVVPFYRSYAGFMCCVWALEMWSTKLYQWFTVKWLPYILPLPGNLIIALPVVGMDDWSGLSPSFYYFKESGRQLIGYFFDELLTLHVPPKIHCCGSILPVLFFRRVNRDLSISTVRPSPPIPVGSFANMNVQTSRIYMFQSITAFVQRFNYRSQNTTDVSCSRQQ